VVDDADQIASWERDLSESGGRSASERRRRRIMIWFSVGVVAFLLLVVGGPWLYFHLQGTAPKVLTLPVGPGGTTGPLNGAWKVSAPSEVQYRVQEILFGQHHTAVGTTSKVTGHMTIVGATVTSAQFTVNMASVKSDQAGRNVVFDDQIMDTSTYPNGYFTLTRAIDFKSVPGPDKVVDVDAQGTLSLRGKSRPVTFPLETERAGNGIDVNGSLTIHFGLWGIPNPSFAIAQVGSTGTVDLLLHLVPASS
jgi:polyisoprenoid-binding protein YceI